MLHQSSWSTPVSHAIELRCPDCSARFDLYPSQSHCWFCGATLEVQYDYDAVADQLTKSALAGRSRDIWRYAELLPCTGPPPGARGTLTPLHRAQRLAATLGLRELWLKDDSVSWPTLSYKDRGIAVAVQYAVHAGLTEIACVSTGNVGNSVAAHAARAGMRAFVCYPRDMETAKHALCDAYGANTIHVDATYDVLNRICKEVGRDCDLTFANISYRPFYAEGAKTLTFEIVEQLGFRMPDHIIVPVAGATLLVKVEKALGELRTIGLAAGEPQIHAVQPLGCSPVASALLGDEQAIRPMTPSTFAMSLAIGAPGDGDRGIAAVRRSKGRGVAVTDEAIREAISLLARTEGIFAEPAAGNTLAGLIELVGQGTIGRDVVAVVALTGHGLKTLDLAVDVSHMPKLLPCDADLLAEEIAVIRQRHNGREY
jgi:threonine synthase